MQQQIHEAIRKLEESAEEVEILLRMSETTWEHYLNYKEGKDSKPKQLGEWNEESLQGEFQNIIKTIENLEVLKRLLEKLL